VNKPAPAPRRSHASVERDDRGGHHPIADGVEVYLTVHEVAAMARCEHKSVRRAIASGRLRAFRPTTRLLIRDDDARAWIEARPVATTVLAPSRRRAPSRPRRTPQSQSHGSVADLREIEREAV
jgi:excisionase family DNA binding protein